MKKLSFNVFERFGKYKNLIITLYFIIITILIILILWRSWDLILQYKYDLQNNNKDVTSIAEIENILDDFPIIPIDSLSPSYLKYTKSNHRKYKRMLKGSIYYVVPKQDVNRKIAGRFRIKDFMCKDKYFNSNQDLYWLMDKKVLFKTIELLDSLESRGLNKDGFYVNNGHRHPRRNEKIKGASQSKHIKGQAVDIVIQDINNDGKHTKKDKDIVLKLLDKHIIKNEGGIGLYPGTQSVHYDVRGKRARWNSY